MLKILKKVHYNGDLLVIANTISLSLATWLYRGSTAHLLSSSGLFKKKNQCPSLVKKLSVSEYGKKNLFFLKILSGVSLHHSAFSLIVQLLYPDLKDKKFTSIYMHSVVEEVLLVTNRLVIDWPTAFNRSLKNCHRLMSIDCACFQRIFEFNVTPDLRRCLPVFSGKKFVCAPF